MNRMLVDSELVGETIQMNYAIEERFAQGGMAWIYKATDLRNQAPVVLKILFSKWLQDPKLRDRFVQEARIHLQLKHPNIIQMYEFIEDAGLMGMAMELVERGDLKMLLEQQDGPLSFQEIQEIFFPMVEAMAYAHQQGVIHRDLKPGNVLLSHDGDVWIPKLTDFGIAKVLQEPGVTSVGAKLGTPEYMAPEQWRDSKSVDHRADIYSLGIILYRMMTGKLPFSGDYQTIIIKVIDDPPPYPVDVPAPLAGVLLRALEKDPDKRFGSCEAFLAVLTRFMKEHLPQPDSPKSVSAGLSTLPYIAIPQPPEQEPLTEELLSGDTLPEDLRVAAATLPEDMELVISKQPNVSFAQSATTPSNEAPSDFRRTMVWGGDAEQQGTLDEDYEQALQKAAEAEQHEQHARMKTMVLPDDDPAIEQLKSLMDKGSDDDLVAVPTISPPLWMFVVAGVLLLAVGMLFGWWISRSG